MPFAASLSLSWSRSTCSGRAPSTGSAERPCGGLWTDVVALERRDVPRAEGGGEVAAAARDRDPAAVRLRLDGRRVAEELDDFAGRVRARRSAALAPAVHAGALRDT